MMETFLISAFTTIVILIIVACFIVYYNSPKY